LERLVNVESALRELILKAYDLKEYQLVAPEWMSTERYDITATMAAGSDLNQVQQMIQSMLSDRSDSPRTTRCGK